MKPLRFVGRDEPLQAEQGAYVLPSMLAIARREFIGRKLFGTAVQFIPETMQTYSYDKLTEVSNARIDPKYPGAESLDLISAGRTSVNIPTLHKETVIMKADLDASRTSGAPLDTSTIDSLTYRVGLLEDKMLLQGTATTDGVAINGLYNEAVANGNKDTTDYDWATPATIITSINAAIALMKADHINGPYDLTIEAEAAGYLSILTNSGAGPGTYGEWVQKRIGGQIYETEVLTVGTALLSKANNVGAFKYVIAEDLRVKTELQSVREGEGLFAKVYIRGLPVVYDPNALCAITNIS
jgi:uncharacterized linocin/CFP29 family protein